MIDSFPASVYADRLRRVRNSGLDALIIGPGDQLAYLTGLRISTHERFSALIALGDGEMAFVVPQVDRSHVQDLGLPIYGWSDGEDPYAIVATMLEHAQVVGVGSELTADHLLQLQSRLTAKTVLATNALSELFTRKDPEEIAQLRTAGQAIDRVHAQVPGLLRAGRTEREVAADIHELIAAEHSVVDFVIVGSAANGANPHHDYSDRILEEGDMVVVDIGGTVGAGYHSDCTRTYIVGGPSALADAEMARMYEVLYDAQAAARAMVRPGVTAQEVDAAARDVITAAGYGEYFCHRTGHGIGLSTHEEPFIVAGNALVLEPGMAFSIEPGIYLPGKFGARIEDIVVVTEAGYESLNNQPRELQ